MLQLCQLYLLFLVFCLMFEIGRAIGLPVTDPRMIFLMVAETISLLLLYVYTWFCWNVPAIKLITFHEENAREVNPNLV